MDESIAWETIDQALASLHIPELVDWRAREVFRDRQAGRHASTLCSSVATFQAPDRTLREEELKHSTPASSKQLAKPVRDSGHEMGAYFPGAAAFPEFTLFEEMNQSRREPQ